MKEKIIAYKGIQGAYSHLAYKNLFPDAKALACDTFHKAMQMVENAQVNLAMIPIENSTRFLILTRDNSIPQYDSSCSYITSLIFSVRNIPAALYKGLGGFATNGVNLIKLESYSVTGSMDSSQFHIDIDGHIDQKSLILALEELEFFAYEVKVLGVYKRNP